MVVPCFGYDSVISPMVGGLSLLLHILIYVMLYVLYLLVCSSPPEAMVPSFLPCPH